MELARAEEVARRLTKLITPVCDRVEVAGSVRRKKPTDIKDIELVAIPKIKEIRTGTVDLATGEERLLMTNGLDWFMRQATAHPESFFQHAPPNKAGSKSPFSERYYKFLFDGCPIDLFCVLAPASWGAILTIRTGDRDFSHKLVQVGYERGIHEIDGHLEKWTLNGEPVKSIAPVRDMLREVIYTPEEEHYFQALGVPWVPPEQRVTTTTTASEWEKWAEEKTA